MAKYLDSILKTMPAIQARQITDVLNKLKESGAIRNTDEYQLKLKELASLVNDSSPKPSFKMIRSLVWNFASSDAHNEMMTSLQNDIAALFEQVDEIGTKTDDHHFLMMKNLFADLERGIDDQENKIHELEWLANQSNEFSIALVNSFKSASINRVARSSSGAETLYFDNRTYKNKTVKELPSAVVSENGNKLLLGTSNDPHIKPISVKLLSNSSSYGTQIQPEVNNPIENIIDGTIGTFWTRDVYLADKVEKVSTVLQFDLGTSKDIDYVCVEGAAETPFFIEKVEGIAPDGKIIILYSTETKVEKNIRLDFQKHFLSGIKITFFSDTYNRAEYYTDKKSSVFKVLEPDDKFDGVEKVQALGPLATEVLSSKNLSDILNVPSGVSQQINSFLYPFALDNVWCGNSLYNDSGIFVSKPLKGDNFGVIGVQVNELLTAPDSIEYEIIKRDLSPKYAETKFPIPYLGQTSVANERLILTKREVIPQGGVSTISNAGVLRFCPYVSPTYNPSINPTPVQVLENGKELSVGADYKIAISLNNSNTNLQWIDNYTSTADFSNYTLGPPKMWIKINKVKTNSVYTVNYDIRTSDSHSEDDTLWLDNNKSIFLTDGGRVNLIRQNPDVNIQSEIYLQITLRRNSASRTTTPTLNEYAVLGATYNG